MASRGPRWILLIVALCAVGSALWALRAAKGDIAVSAITIGEIPATLFSPSTPARGPVVVIAHGFAGSQQLMQPFATTFARNGYAAITFDFSGHGRNPTPLAGSITELDGATRTLVGDLARVGAFAGELGDGRLAVLGHSMASDIVVRYAQSEPKVGATIAVSMFSPAVTAESPGNLLVIAGGWEGMLKREALRAASLVSAKADPPVAQASPGVTYGSFGGIVRRAAFSPHVEHVGVLYSRESMREAQNWIDASFGVSRADAPYFDSRGPWIMLLLAGLALLGKPLAGLLPVVSNPPAGAALPWRRMWLPLLLPAVATPLLLRVLPTHFLPVLVGDYLAAHFAMYGLLTALCLAWMGRSNLRSGGGSAAALVVATAACVAFGFVCVIWPLDTFVASFAPGRGRALLVAAMLVGTLAFFLSDEWLTRGAAEGRRLAAPGAYAATKAAFLVSLGAAVALDFERLFFLVIIIPVILVFFMIHGLFSRWIYLRTGHPLVAAIAHGIAFAWAIGVTFPLLAG